MTIHWDKMGEQPEKRTLKQCMEPPSDAAAVRAWLVDRGLAAVSRELMTSAALTDLVVYYPATDRYGKGRDDPAAAGRLD